jgi:glycosyltransferase involved in cell wall biosynthesis
MAVAVCEPEPAVSAAFPWWRVPDGIEAPIGPRVSVIIPALNEAQNLPLVLPRIPVWVYEVILVDGGSNDETPEVARRAYPAIRVINQLGRGKGAALRSGIAAARGDIVVHLDADGSTDPAEIPAFVGALLAGADFAKGTRFIQGGGTADMPVLRRIGNWVFVTLANLLFHVRFSDITYGYNAIWRRHQSALALEISGWPQEIISNIRLTQAGLRVVEVASFEYRRLAGEAKLTTFAAGAAILVAMLRERLHKRPSTIPTSTDWPLENPVP